MSRRDVATKHQRRIARQDANMPEAMRNVMAPPAIIRERAPSEADPFTVDDDCSLCGAYEADCDCSEDP